MKQPSYRMTLFMILLLMVASTGLLVRAQGKLQVEWHPATLRAENYNAAVQIVDAFNASQDDVELTLVAFPAASTQDYLDTASGMSRNVVVTHLSQRWSKSWRWLDMTPLIDTSQYDLSRYDPCVINMYRQDGTLKTLPIVVYPLVLYYNRDLFDAAGVAYPPHGIGETYADGETWDMAKLKEIALQLTHDEQGHTALDPRFDPEAIVQYGFTQEYYAATEYLMAPFGAGSLITDTRRAVMPESWRAGLAWYYDGWWTSHFISSWAVLPNPLESGRVAMVFSGLWLTCCLVSDAHLNWDLAMLPGYNGQVTSYLYEDGIRILESSPDPEAAFKVAAYLSDHLSERDWPFMGGLPPQTLAYAGYSDILETWYPEQAIDWQVGIDTMTQALLSYNERLPASLEEGDREWAFLNRLQTTPDLNLDAEIDVFLHDLQKIFDEDEPPEP